MRRWAPWVAAFGVPFGIYLLTMAPTVYNLDSAERDGCSACFY